MLSELSDAKIGAEICFHSHCGNLTAYQIALYATLMSEISTASTCNKLTSDYVTVSYYTVYSMLPIVFNRAAYLVPAVVVPDGAVVLDWVFADGLPQQAIVYDNNDLRDFHAIVPKSIPGELYWVEEEKQIYRKLQAERRLREESIRAKVSFLERL